MAQQQHHQTQQHMSGSHSITTMANNEASSSNESSDSTPSSEGETWIEWFCSLGGNHYFAKIDPGYVGDNFNLFGLKGQYLTSKDYITSLTLLRDEADESTMVKDGGGEDEGVLITSNAQLLYGLIHARFLVTTRGLECMAERYRRHEFGTCPRQLCASQPVLPTGLFDEPGKATVRLYCPSCSDVYHPAGMYATTNVLDLELDGAYFGTTFAPLFFLTYPSLNPEPCTRVYVPKIFGYQIYNKDTARGLLRQRIVRSRTGMGGSSSQYKDPEDQESGSGNNTTASSRMMNVDEPQPPPSGAHKSTSHTTTTGKKSDTMSTSHTVGGSKQKDRQARNASLKKRKSVTS